MSDLVPHNFVEPSHNFVSNEVISPSAQSRKRIRSAKACIACHNRKVKCDVSTKEVDEKCSNCKYSGAECIIYIRKKRSANKSKLEKHADIEETDDIDSISENDFRRKARDHRPSASTSSRDTNGTLHKNTSLSLLSNMNDMDTFVEEKPSSTIPVFPSSFLKPSVQNTYPHLSKIKLDPNVVLKENMYDLMSTEFGVNNQSNNFMKEIINVALDKITENYKRSYTLDQTDFQILDSLGCFTLPDEKTCWRYIENYFTFINCQLPIIDKENFYENYSDLQNPPSLLLLNSVLFVGSWHTNSESDNLDEQFEQCKVSQIFFKRAKLLYEYSVEAEPIALIQSLLCFSFNYDNMSNLGKNDYYWTHVAINVALQFGFHLRPPADKSPYYKEMTKRLFWMLFYKDRLTSFGFSRPSTINLNDCELDVLGLNDLSNFKMSQLEKIYLVNLIKFGKLLDKIDEIQHEIAKSFSSSRPILHLMKKCDLLMIKYIQNLPKELKFKFNDKSSHSFLAVLSLSQYYTLVVSVHRGNILRGCGDYYPSWAISFQAVQMIKRSSDYLAQKKLINKVAVLAHNTLTSSMIIMLYHLLNEEKTISKIANDFFLRTLGIWRATHRKFPVCYPMLCIFGCIYNSEDYLKQIVTSVAPKDNNNLKPSFSSQNLKSKETGKDLRHSLKLPDIPFLSDPDFKIENLKNNPFHLTSSSNFPNENNKLEIEFDKLFLESVFTNGDSLLPKLDFNCINVKSNDSKGTFKADTCDGNTESQNGIEERNPNSLNQNSAYSQHHSRASYNTPSANGKIVDVPDPSTANMNASSFQQQISNNKVTTFNSSNSMDIHNVANNDTSQSHLVTTGQERLEDLQKDNDFPISMWMMTTNWKPKFNIGNSNDVTTNIENNVYQQSTTTPTNFNNHPYEYPSHALQVHGAQQEPSHSTYGLQVPNNFQINEHMQAGQNALPSLQVPVLTQQPNILPTDNTPSMNEVVYRDIYQHMGSNNSKVFNENNNVYSHNLDYPNKFNPNFADATAKYNSNQWEQKPAHLPPGYYDSNIKYKYSDNGTQRPDPNYSPNTFFNGNAITITTNNNAVISNPNNNATNNPVYHQASPPMLYYDNQNNGNGNGNLGQ